MTGRRDPLEVLGELLVVLHDDDQRAAVLVALRALQDSPGNRMHARWLASGASRAHDVLDQCVALTKDDKRIPASLFIDLRLLIESQNVLAQNLVRGLGSAKASDDDELEDERAR